MKRVWSGLLGVTLALATALGAQAQSWPTKPIRLIIGFAPGGPTDTLARTVAEQLTQSLPQPTVVENKPGAASNLAAETVVKSPADGHTLFLGGMGPYSINGALYSNMTFDADKDLIPLTVVGRSPLVLAVSNALPIKSVRELIDYAKANAGKINHSSPGVGTSPHLADELFRMLAGFDSTHVVYKSSPQVLNAIIQGETQWAFDVPLTALPQHANGKLRVIAIAATARDRAYPEIATLSEQGFPDVSMYAWFAMAAPAGTPKDVVDRLNAEIIRALRTEQVKSRFAAIGFEPAPMSSAETGKFFADERVRWTKVIQANNIKGE